MAMTVYSTRKCHRCGKGGILSVDEDQLFEWLSGSPIQVAFNTLPAELREQLLSGIHPECWASIFAGVDDDN